jgi:hypothetical protein
MSFDNGLVCSSCLRKPFLEFLTVKTCTGPRLTHLYYLEQVLLLGSIFRQRRESEEVEGGTGRLWPLYCWRGTVYKKKDFTKIMPICVYLRSAQRLSLVIASPSLRWRIVAYYPKIQPGNTENRKWTQPWGSSFKQFINKKPNDWNIFFIQSSCRSHCC